MSEENKAVEGVGSKVISEPKLSAKIAEETRLEVIDRRHSAPELKRDAGGEVQMSEAGALVSQAMRQGLSVEHIQALIDMKNAEEDRAAKKLYIAAMARFKAKCPIIKKGKRVFYQPLDKATNQPKGPPVEYNHVDLGILVGTLAPLMSEEGLSHRWIPLREQERIKVQCWFAHEGGHEEMVAELFAPPDQSGGKNNLQAMGSTLSYLQRYTFGAGAGLGFVEDDDGRGFSGQSEGHDPDATKAKPAPEPLSAYALKVVDGFVRFRVIQGDLEAFFGSPDEPLAAKDWSEDVLGDRPEKLWHELAKAKKEGKLDEVRRAKFDIEPGSNG